jgi:D-lactate dehydrogenase
VCSILPLQPTCTNRSCNPLSFTPVAEHAVTLLMSVNRKIAAASVRVKMSDFSLDTSLLGMDIHGKTVGVMGTGKIGQILCKIINGFGVNLLAYDVFESDVVKSLGGKYVSKEAIYENCDVIFLMMPLLPATKHTINESVLPLLKKGVLIVNTSRGGLIDTKALVSGLQSDIIGGCGLDVYENEGDYFFRDWSGKVCCQLITTCAHLSTPLILHSFYYHYRPFRIVL